MEGAPGCTTGGLGVTDSDELSSPPPHDINKVDEIHTKRNITVARNAATRVLIVLSTDLGCIVAVACEMCCLAVFVFSVQLIDC